MDEEARKRNTDCVYFLASPLTCKKGIQCEFRHSEAARFNPRDCWYWLAGNCLNANCSFRHPPLDGRPAAISASAPAPSKPALMPSVAATSLSMPANKSRAPCYFFCQGFCAKGDRCTFLHCSGLSTSAQVVDAQKPPKAPASKGAETIDKPMRVIETNGPTVKKDGSQDVKPGALMTPANSLRPNVFIRTEETSCFNNDAAKVRNSKVSKTSLSTGHQSTHAPSIKRQNSPDLHGRRQSVKLQRQIRDELQLELVKFAESKHQQTFSGEEGTQNGTWKHGPVKEGSPCFLDESDNSVYGEDLPYPIANARFSRRSFSCNHTQDFGLCDEYLPTFYDTCFATEQGSCESFDLLYDYSDQHSFRSAKVCHHSRPFYARRDRQRIKGDLRDLLSRRRNNFQDQVSDINGYSDGFQDMDDHANVDERDWDDSLDWAASRRDRVVYQRRLCSTDHRRVRFPNYGFRLDFGGDNVDQVSSGSSPTRFSVGRSYGSRGVRCYSTLEESDAGTQPRLESEIYAEDWLQAQGADILRSEIHSSSGSAFAKRPFIKSRVLPASTSEEADVRGATSYNFEGPKPLSILLQRHRKIKEDDRGDTPIELAGFNREEHANDLTNYLNRFHSEEANITGRKRKQGDHFGRF